MSNKIKLTKAPVEAVRYTGGGNNYEEIADFLGDDIDTYASEDDNYILQIVENGSTLFLLAIGEYIFKNRGTISKLTQEKIDKGEWIVVSEQATPIEKGNIHVKQVRQSQFEAFVESYKLRQIEKNEPPISFSTNDERILSMIYVYTLVDSNNNPMAFYRNTPSWLLISHEPKLFWIKDTEKHER
jgi:hypothetical protein